MSNEVLITGARGWIGGHLARRMTAAGWRVTGVSRTPEAAPELAGCTWISAGPELDEAVARIGVVVNLAGRHPFEQRWDEGYKTAMYDSRVGLTRRIVAALEVSSVRERILVSGSGFPVYGDAGEIELTEDVPVAGEPFVARMDAEWERVAETAARSGVRVVLARIGLALGSDGGALPMLRAAAEAGNPQSFGTGSQWVPWVHIDDVVELLLRAVTDAHWAGPVNLAAPAPARHRALIDALAALSGATSVTAVSEGETRAALGEAADILLLSGRIVPRRALGLGYRFRHDDLTEALAAIFPMATYR
jgi:uncharacterized protein (TIGR01777 family)